MRILSHRATAIVSLLACTVGTALAASKPQPALLDEGKLDKSWYAADAEFREADEIDYLWVSPGFDLAGKALAFAPWPAPQFLGESARERDTKDMRLAEEMNGAMPQMFHDAFRRAFGDRIRLEGKPDLRVEGRIVDCSTGSTAAKVWVGFGAGSGNTTIDVRFVDTATGKTVAGFHHRVVSGSTWSTTDSKFMDWLDETAERAAKKGFAELYKKGDRVKE